MTEDRTRLGSGPPLIHVQVATTDRSRADLDNGIPRLLNARVLDLLHCNFAGFLINDSSHGLSLPMVGMNCADPLLRICTGNVARDLPSSGLMDETMNVYTLMQARTLVLA